MDEAIHISLFQLYAFCVYPWLRYVRSCWYVIYVDPSVRASLIVHL